VALDASHEQQDPYTQLYKAISTQIDQSYSSLAAATADKKDAASRRILRIAIQSLISPTWPATSPQVSIIIYCDNIM
jgi:hypothetical protein